MAFNIPNQTSYILQRPEVTQPEWVRPADWITITDVADEVQFLVSNLLLSAYTLTTEFDRPSSENLYIDWGDGTIDTISTNTTTDTSHEYITSGTPCSLGYDTYKIRVYVDAGATITTCNHTKPSTTTNPNVVLGVLEAYYGDGTILNPANINYDSGDTSKPQFRYLEYVKLPSSLPTPGSSSYRFRNCTGLSKFVMPTSGLGFVTLEGFFDGCISLQSITLPSDLDNLTNLFRTFINCSSLTGATVPSNLDLVTTTSFMFENCYSLSSFQMPSLANCTDFSRMFQNCYNLITMEIDGFTSGATGTTISSIFNGCSSLEYVKFPTTVNETSITCANAFQNCTNLKSFIFPTNFNTTSLSSFFTGCVSLASVTLPTSMSLLTSASLLFQNCSALQNVTLPTTVGATIALDSLFINCRSISSVIIPSGYTITSMSSAFNGCTSLANVILPANAQNSITTMANAFSNCNTLTSVTLPTSLNAATSLLNLFSSCISLTGATFPATMNSVTTMSAIFNNCQNLQSVTLPTSMSSLTTMANAFNSCFLLKSLTLPATVAATLTSFGQVCQNCRSLETVILPTTQTTSLNSVTLAFNNCFNLKTITNADKFGNTSTAATIYILGTGFSTGAEEMTGTADFYCKFSRLDMNGTATIQSKLTSLRLRNNGAGQYGGASPQINISYTSLDATALDQVFTDLPTVTAKTIDITGASGAGGCDRTIATAKGWTVTG